jgi:hypothetical protein
MLVVVAVDTEKLPVAAVGRVVVMIVVPVVDRQFAKLLAFEFPDASGADMGEKLQGLFPVSGLAQLFFLAHLCNDLGISLFFRLGHITPFN